MEFFKFDEYCNTNFSIYEIVIPVAIIILIICLCTAFRTNLSNTVLSKKIKKTVFIIYIVTFLSDYIFTYSQFGIAINSLPLELCTFGAVLSMISLVCNNNRIVYFLEAVSLPAALMAILNPATGGDYMHLQYYLFMINHGLTIIIPAFYIFVERRVCRFKNIIESMGILFCISVFICIFNTAFDTSYFFLSLTRNPYSFGIIGALGKAPLYVFKLALLGVSILLVWGGILLLTGRILSKFENNELVEQSG